MVYFVIDADIYWPKLVVKILLWFSKKKKRHHPDGGSWSQKDSEVGADCICKRVRRHPEGNEDLTREKSMEWFLECLWS